MTLLDLTTEAEDVVGVRPALRAAAWMAAFPGRWAIAGGWALDLFLGQVTRGHGEDEVEVAVFREDQRKLHDYLYFSRWTFEARMGSGAGGEHTERWDGREWLDPPVFEVRASSPDEQEHLGIRLQERRGRQWRYRRSASVSLPIERAFVRGAWNVPVLAPEVVLLQKSPAPEAKDSLDFRAVAERLDEQTTTWLTETIGRAHPGSPFLREMAVRR